MAKINVLPKNVAELIAAGEVVERPMSVVKELIENSIDAGADNIAVEIKNGGVKYIRITDNGCGIAREDVPTAFISHATSKIRDASDLAAIFTLGFRGEALPSVAAVSKLSMLTKTESEETGTNFRIEGGEIISVDDAGCPTGTTIIVRDLFYNTPARMKFLRRDITEGTYVSDAVTKVALSHPDVKFTLIKDGKRVISTNGSGDLFSAVYSIFGKDVADALLKCDYEDGQIKIHGFISRPLSNRPNRNMQFFFVNGRCVRVPAAVPALDEAYKNSIMVGKFPMCFLSLEIPPEKTDVNVHPAKTEIRFAEETKLFEAVFCGTRNALSKGDTARPGVSLPVKKDVTAKAVPPVRQLSFTEDIKPEVPEKTINGTKQSDKPFPEEQKYEKKPFADFDEKKITSYVLRDGSLDKCNNSDSVVDRKSTGYTVPWITEKKPDIDIRVDDEPVVNTEKQDLRPFSVDGNKENSTIFADKFNETENEKKDIPFRIIGEVFKTYIIAEQGDKLLIIDKHAAHERMIFNSIASDMSKNGSQLLLSPVFVTLSPKEYSAVIENIEVFEKAGFTVEDFGSGTVAVRECPVELTNADISLVTEEMAGKLLKGNMRPVPEKLDWLYHSTACRAAVKAGDELKPEETEIFVKKLLADESIKYCPHGRPVMYELSKHELEKQFGRLG